CHVPFCWGAAIRAQEIAAHANVSSASVEAKSSHAPAGAGGQRCSQRRLWSTNAKTPRLALVPRTRSSHHNCCESVCELRVQSGTRIIELLVSFDSEVRIRACRKLRRTSESGH